MDPHGGSIRPASTSVHIYTLVRYVNAGNRLSQKDLRAVADGVLTISTSCPERIDNSFTFDKYATCDTRVDIGGGLQYLLAGQALEYNTVAFSFGNDLALDSSKLLSARRYHHRACLQLEDMQASHDARPY